MSRCLAPLIATIAATALLGLTAPASAISPAAADAAHDARVQLMGPGDDVEPLLSAICPDGVIIDEGRAACRSCPDDAPDSLGSLTLRRIYRGHFSASSTQEAVVALNGCSRDPAERHATAFLKQTQPGEDRWELVRYEQGKRSSPCRLSAIDETPLLLCRDMRHDGTAIVTDIRAMIHTGQAWHVKTLTSIGDGTDDCEFEGSRVRQVQRVFTGPLLEDETHALALLLEVQTSTPRTEDPAECSEDHYDVERTWRLELFVATDDGLQSVEPDAPCAHPNRARILTGADPNACR